MNFKNISDQNLLSSTIELVSREKEILLQILWHLKEIERRKVYSDLGCKSLFDYGVKKLKYSESQMYRRISAMRALKENPQIEKQISTGSLSLSNITQTQSFFRVEKIVSKEKKKEVFKAIENKSSHEAEKVLLSISSNEEPVLPKERQRQITVKYKEVKFIMGEELENRIEELRSLLNPNEMNCSFSELVDKMAQLSIEVLKKKRFGVKKTKNLKDDLSAPKKRCGKLENKNLHRKDSRYIPKPLKKEIWQRDKGKCKNCDSTKYLQYDHIRPIAKNGKTAKENLRLLCSNCNQRAAVKHFGLRE